jgi:hypothetical protein
MQISDAAQFLLCVGSHSVPRLVVEPQTLYVPEPVVTGLHWLNLSAFLHASVPASASQPM